MGIFDQFQSREDLLKAVESAIQSKTVKPEGDGGGAERDVFFIADESQAALAEIKAKFDTAVKDNQNYRKRAQTAESSLAELKQENARLAATLEEHSKLNPEKQREEINRLLDEVGKLKADNKALSEQVEPLNRVIADYKAKEKRDISGMFTNAPEFKGVTFGSRED